MLAGNGKTQHCLPLRHDGIKHWKHQETVVAQQPGRSQAGLFIGKQGPSHGRLNARIHQAVIGQRIEQADVSPQPVLQNRKLRAQMQQGGGYIGSQHRHHDRMTEHQRVR
ncbi:hypothetical protein D3C81_1598050 [compost metagenome]